MNKNNRIGIFGLQSDNSLEQFYIDSFKELKFKNIKFLSNNSLFKLFCILNNYKLFFLLGIFNFFQKKRIEKFLDNNKIDTFIIFKGIELDSSIFDILKKKKINLINIYTDDPFNFNSSATTSINVIQNIKNFDLFCIWSQKLKKRLESKFKKNNFYYLPFGFSEKKHIKLNTKIKKNNLSFVASFDGYRLKKLNKIKRRISIYGNDWPNKSKHKIYKFVEGKNLSKIIAQSEASLNILKKQNLSSHNMRTFEIPAMGGLMITTRSLEQNKYFPENKAAYMFESIDELNKKLDYIVKNPKQALKVRQRGYKLSKQYSYKKRLKELINYVNSNKKILNFRYS